MHKREGGENGDFKIESGMRQGCVVSPWFFNVYMDVVMKKVKIGIGRIGVKFLEKGREWRLVDLFYEDDLVLCGESEEKLKVMVGHFVDVCRRGLKVNADKRKVMVLFGEEELDGLQLEQVSRVQIFGMCFE